MEASGMFEDVGKPVPGPESFILNSWVLAVGSSSGASNLGAVCEEGSQLETHALRLPSTSAAKHILVNYHDCHHCHGLYCIDLL